MFKQICRTCLQISQDMHLINKLSKDNNIIIEQMLLKVMPEFNKDELTPAPLEICEICLKKLKISYNFHLQCMEINKKLKKMLTAEDQSDNLVAEQDMKINESSEKEINEILNSIKQEDTAVANETVQYIVKEEYEIQEMDFDRPFPMEMQTEENESLDGICNEGLRIGQIHQEETDTKQLQEMETMQHCQKETNNLSAADIVTVREVDSEFSNLLNKYGLEKYYLSLTNAKINNDCFKAMTEADIKEIFNDEIGTRIKFRGLVNEWRLANQLAPITTCCSKHSDQSSASGSVSQSDSISSFSEPSLHNFLDSAIGIKICANYKANNELGASDRETLMSNIVRDHLEKDVPMNYAMFDNITEDIVKRFASEKKEYYFQKEKRNGKLYNKYRSMSRAFRKSGFLKKYLRARTINKLELKSREVNAISVSGIDSEDKLWLKTRNSPWETVELKWNSSCALRRQDINIHPLQFILSDWPLYAHSNGYRLIDCDFHNLYPEKSNLFLNNWNSLKDKIIAVCKNIVKFPAAKKIINNLPTNKDLELIEVLKVLAAIFKPVARKTIEKQTWKVSTGDAWNSFVVEINSDADIQSTINKRKEFCVSKNINFQPFLIILRDRNDINSYQYVLVVESLIYRFADAFNAFDIYFKCFFVFNLEYPFENTIFWNFVQHFFYDIPTTKINSPELDILTQLKQK